MNYFAKHMQQGTPIKIADQDSAAEMEGGFLRPLGSSLLRFGRFVVLAARIENNKNVIFSLRKLDCLLIKFSLSASSSPIKTLVSGVASSRRILSFEENQNPLSTEIIHRHGRSPSESGSKARKARNILRARKKPS